MYFCDMKKMMLLLVLLSQALAVSAYNDYRGHNLDSLERAVARWTPDAVDRATEQELLDLNRAYRDLMLGYSQLSTLCVEEPVSSIPSTAAPRPLN